MNRGDESIPQPSKFMFCRKRFKLFPAEDVFRNGRACSLSFTDPIRPLSAVALVG